MNVPKAWILAATIAIAIAYLASGIFVVQPDERGVVQWFGRVPLAKKSIPPGMHYAPPWPICKVSCPKTTEVRRVYVGLMPNEREAIASGDIDAVSRSPSGDMLTGDVNILKPTVVVQYQVLEPDAFLFNTEHPEALIHNTVQAVLIEELAGLPVDEALTIAISSLQTGSLTRAQELLDQYESGVRLVAVNLETISPPRAIMDAFQEVVSAKKDGEKDVDFAVAESNRILAGARGQAAALCQESLSFQQTRVRHARGEAHRFISIMREYQRAPEVYRERLLLQTLEKVLPDVKTYIIDRRPGDPGVHLKIVGTRSAQESTAD